jgi:hypothetical protein
MSSYTKATNFATKDTLPTGDSNKIVKGTEIDNEFNAISGAISSKADIASPTFTGTPAAPTATAGSNTTQLANTAYVKVAVDALGTIGTMAAQNKTAVDITGGTVVGITDITVADGGTGRSTLTDKAVLIGAGTSGINSVAPGTSGNVLKSDGTNWTSAAPVTVSGLGLNGETWHNVTGSRSSGTTYTNSYSYPIAVSASGTAANGSPSITIVVNGVTVSYFNWQFNGAGAVSGGFTIVPAGATYSLTFNGSGIGNWAELY